MGMLKQLKNDLYRYSETISLKSWMKYYILSPGFHYICWFRLVSKYKNPILKYILFRKMVKYGIEIYPGTNIGKGFYIGHWGGIVINSQVVIGDNCNISQDVTIGQVNRGNNKGAPIIGNRVYIAPGAKIIGNIKIGDDVAIGANAVVTKDIPDNAVVVGVPAKVISYEGSKEYINNVVG